jgi:glycosyltransferase involved in cell wall biosynthesis
VSGSPTVSLLLPNRNNARVLEKVLAPLAENTTYGATEVVAVDDGSTDESVGILRRWRDSRRFESFELVEKPSSGAIDTLNTALERASGQFCIQLDADAAVETPGWIERMLRFMALDDAVGVVTAKVVMDWGELHACGVSVVDPVGWHDRPARPTEPVGRRRWHYLLERVPEGHGGEAERRVTEVDSGIGCCMMYRREDALRVGGYDRGYSPVWLDDVDLCLSIRALGRKAFYLPDVRVRHYVRDRAGLRARLRPRRVGRALARQAARSLPSHARDRIEKRFDIDLGMGHFSPEERARLRHHYGYWRQKWGWDPLNPDMGEIQRRWGGTEVCWATDAIRRAAGERIVRSYELARRNWAVGAA